MIKPVQKDKPYLPYNGMLGLAEYYPDNAKDFSLTVEIGIGEDGKLGFDNYQLQVCTTKWLENEILRNGRPIFIRGMLLVEEYDAKAIQERISELIKTINGKDWEECNRKITHYFNWEFEDA